MAQFEFNSVFTPQSLLDVEHLGKCAIEAFNDEGVYYYLVIRTSLGLVSIAQCGPVVPDVGLLPDGYMCKLEKIDYKEDKIILYINKWLNDRSKKLTNAKEITIEDAISQFRDLRPYLEDYGEDTY